MAISVIPSSLYLTASGFYVDYCVQISVQCSMSSIQFEIFGTYQTALLIISIAKDTTSNSNHSTSAGNCKLIIARHLPLTKFEVGSLKFEVY